MEMNCFRSLYLYFVFVFTFYVLVAVAFLMAKASYHFIWSKYGEGQCSYAGKNESIVINLMIELRFLSE